ncbi:MAG: dihydrodipicolinate synthase family protein [Anaerolineae bacterium]|nr:dihydrodipicolinate synthase family protein [Anaerolineae bacterium]
MHKGAWPAMVTPYDDALRIDRGAYAALIEWYIAHGVGGLYANCLTSEMYLQEGAERLLLVRDAVTTAAGRVPVAATGNLGDTVEAHIALCRRVADAGADVVMLVVPEFHDNDADLERYFLTIAGAVEAPLGIYECPVPRSYHLGVALVAKLARTGRFVAFKETSEDLTKIVALLRATQGTPLALLQANTPYLLDATRAGAPGSMSIAAAWLPDLVAAVIAAGRTGDPDAERLQAELCALEMVQRVVHPQGTKYLLGKRGAPITTASRHPRSPLTANVVRALEYCAAVWFDGMGELICLRTA